MTCMMMLIPYTFFEVIPHHVSYNKQGWNKGWNQCWKQGWKTSEIIKDEAN